jgi:hypothetical protein
MDAPFVTDAHRWSLMLTDGREGQSEADQCCHEPAAERADLLSLVLSCEDKPFELYPSAEIDQETELIPRILQVAKQLGLVALHQAIHGLRFDDHSIIYKQINDLLADLLIAEVNRYHLLVFSGQSQLLKFYGESVLVDFFTQSLSQGVVDVEGRTNDFFRQLPIQERLIRFHFGRPSVVIRVHP